jgi:hypothetical protein
MLNLESRMQVLGVTVFQDFDRPTQFYYLPGSPHISRERGEPIFDLFSYRKGGQAESTLSGGFLNMAVDLSLGSLRERILNQLKEQYGSPRARLESWLLVKTAARRQGQKVRAPRQAIL